MAEVDMFLKLNGVTGESQDKVHSGEMDLLNWTWSLANNGNFHTGSGGGVGKSDFHDIQITKLVDSATPTLMQMCADGSHINTATLTCRKSGGTPLEFLVIKMEKVLVSHYSTSGTGVINQEENFSLHFATVHVEYNKQSPTGAKAGSTIMSWNVPGNSKS
jgi:type VI secretion system secreted protein Hcp